MCYGLVLSYTHCQHVPSSARACSCQQSKPYFKGISLDSVPCEFSSLIPHVVHRCSCSPSMKTLVKIFRWNDFAIGWKFMKFAVNHFRGLNKCVMLKPHPYQLVAMPHMWTMDTIVPYSLMKKGPVSNVHPPPIIASISSKGLKFTPKSVQHPCQLTSSGWKVLSSTWCKVSL